jgi:hypothetical protein
MPAFGHPRLGRRARGSSIAGVAGPSPAMTRRRVRRWRNREKRAPESAGGAAAACLALDDGSLAIGEDAERRAPECSVVFRMPVARRSRRDVFLHRSDQRLSSLEALCRLAARQSPALWRAIAQPRRSAGRAAHHLRREPPSEDFLSLSPDRRRAPQAPSDVPGVKSPVKPTRRRRPSPAWPAGPDTPSVTGKDLGSVLQDGGHVKEFIPSGHTSRD